MNERATLPSEISTHPAHEGWSKILNDSGTMTDIKMCSCPISRTTGQDGWTSGLLLLSPIWFHLLHIFNNYDMRQLSMMSFIAEPLGLTHTFLAPSCLTNRMSLFTSLPCVFYF